MFHQDVWGSTAVHSPTPFILSPFTVGPSSAHNTSRFNSYTHKILANILLMSQNYIRSLKLNEYAWQTICFRGTVGRQPRHLASVWYTPRHENVPWYFRTIISPNLYAIPWHRIICIVLWSICLFCSLPSLKRDPRLREILYSLCIVIITFILHHVYETNNVNTEYITETKTFCVIVYHWWPNL